MLYERCVMKIKQALEISKTMGYTVPEDMTDEAMLYWSKSKKEYISILDMDIIHVVRALHRLQINNVNDVVPAVLNSLEEYIQDLRSEYE